MSTLLIDGDIIAYQIAFKTEEAIRWDNDIWTLHSDEKDCVKLIEDWFATIIADTQCEDVVVAFSDKGNFRKSILEDYKANRNDKRKPLTLKFCRDYITKKYVTYVKPNLEADDVLGILGTSNLIEGTKIIVSIDKDLDQIVGLHYHPVRKEFYKISKKEADYNFYYQVLKGDTTDNYKGCPTYGDVKASRVLSTSKNHWETTIKCFVDQGLTKEDALVQARVARILRNTDYNFKKEIPKLWQQ